MKTLESEYPEISIKDKPSTSGDDCHKDIEGLSDNKAQSFFKRNAMPPNVYLCCGTASHAITKDALENLFVSADALCR